MELHIAVLIFEGMTATDAGGPVEVLSRIPGATMHYVGVEVGPVRTETGFLWSVEETIESVPTPDIVVIPGGPLPLSPQSEPRVIKWLQEAHKSTKFTTSVCTGSYLLAQAGLLKGIEATTHWSAMEGLAELGAKPLQKRYVHSAKIISAAGVSAGFDMALYLVSLLGGDILAQAIQVGIEYDPQPPFNSGHPSKAPAAVMEVVMQERASR